METSMEPAQMNLGLHSCVEEAFKTFNLMKKNRQQLLAVWLCGLPPDG